MHVFTWFIVAVKSVCLTSHMGIGLEEPGDLSRWQLGSPCFTVARVRSASVAGRVVRRAGS